MDTKLLVTFIILNIINVVVQTVKSIATVKCEKGTAAIVNAIAYGLYTVVVVYTVCNLPLWLKVVVVGTCNLVGVFVVKWAEEKSRKAKLWKIEATVYEPYANSLHEDLNHRGIPHNYIPNIGKYYIFNVYCDTQLESKMAKECLDRNKAKYFVSETKILD